MEIRLGSQDIPMSLNMTPSGYATGQGGGGDARINVQVSTKKFTVMINGFPKMIWRTDGFIGLIGMGRDFPSNFLSHQFFFFPIIGGI
ncbi:MAG: hypothetical protein CM15mL4_3030 [uncultured marine virus]|nr:MAG: hypothetical protein CM15mL4_3030 [uncultured marine virus]